MSVTSPKVDRDRARVDRKILTHVMKRCFVFMGFSFREILLPETLYRDNAATDASLEIKLSKGMIWSSSNGAPKRKESPIKIGSSLADSIPNWNWSCRDLSDHGKQFGLFRRH